MSWKRNGVKTYLPITQNLFLQFFSKLVRILFRVFLSHATSYRTIEISQQCKTQGNILLIYRKCTGVKTYLPIIQNLFLQFFSKLVRILFRVFLSHTTSYRTIEISQQCKTQWNILLIYRCQDISTYYSKSVQLQFFLNLSE